MLKILIIIGAIGGTIALFMSEGFRESVGDTAGIAKPLIVAAMICIVMILLDAVR